MKNKLLILSLMILLIQVSFIGDSYAERERESNQINSRVESPYVLNTGFTLATGFPYISLNYNFIDKLSAGLGLGYYSVRNSRSNSSSSYSVDINSLRIIANGKLYIYDFNPNFSFYTQTDLGLILGDREIEGGTLFTPGPNSKVARSDFLFQQKIGVEARYAKGIVFNVAWGVFYETMDTKNSPFLVGLFNNSFIPFALDLLVGYSF